MGNTLSGIIPILYRALGTVSRELVGLIPAVTLNADADQVAVNQTVKWPTAPVSSARDVVPATNSPDDGDQTIGSDSMTITKSRVVPVRWNGEEVLSVNSQYAGLLEQQFSQAMRTLTNEVEGDLAGLFASGSRAYGTAGNTPFGTAGDFTDASFALKILKDNGAPTSDLQLVVDTAAGATFRGKQAQAQIAGTDSIQRQGVLLDIHDFAIRESAQIKNHTKGTGASYITAGATAAGVADVAIDTGSGTVLAGDVVSFAADTDNKYIVNTGVAAAGTVTLGQPGLQNLIADNNAMTVGGSYTANMAFARTAINLLVRTPAMPPGGDSADDVMYIMDPVSGLVFQVALYRQYRQIKYEIGLAWGVKAVKPEHIAILLG